MSVKCRCALDHPQCRREFVFKMEGKEVFVMMRWRQAESWKFIRLLRLFLFLSKELRKIMNYGTIKTMDTANGEGLRVSLFVSVGYLYGLYQASSVGLIYFHASTLS